MTLGIPHEEVAKHCDARSCWLIIKNKVYDVTAFLPEHPGGQKIILQYAGKDATQAYDAIHPPGFLDRYLSEKDHLGPVDLTNALPEQLKSSKTKDEERIEAEQKRKPPLKRMLNTADIEAVAMKVMSRKARAYYTSGADDEIAVRESNRAYSRFFFLPRVMRKVSICETSISILGHQSSLPIYISFAGLAKLGHPQGDLNITRGAGRCGIVQMVGTNLSFSHEEIISSRTSTNQPVFFQFYKNADDSIAEKLIRKIESLGYKAIFLTVDAPVLGKRERDERAPFEAEDEELGSPAVHNDVEFDSEEGTGIDGDRSVASAFSKQDDPDKTWDKTIPWLRSITKLPIVLKGIQSVEDALLAVDAKVDGIVISNHGGRQLDYAPPPIWVLYKLRQQHPEVFDNLEVFIDGGVRRGTDVLKALCLGAKAVGMGRPFAYANSAYGEDGIVKLIRIMEREILTGMRLLGAASVKDLVPEMVIPVPFQPKL